MYLLHIYIYIYYIYSLQTPWVHELAEAFPAVAFPAVEAESTAWDS